MKQISLQGKVAIVTGSIQGIGFLTAKTLAEAGANVVINNHRDPETLEKRAEEIRQTGGKCKAVIADCTNREEIQKLVDAALEFGGSIDILVNNAGGLIKRVPVAEFDEDHFQSVIDVNLKSAFMVTSAVIPHITKNGWGRIINLSSQAAHDGGGPGAAAYAASKGGIWTFTKSVIKEVSPHGVTVNAVSPGFIAGTDFHNTFSTKEVHEKVKGNIPLKRLGAPEDIANVILFLASDLGGYVNGQSIQVNGGLYMP
ncbi:MAG: short-chain dehydrogenase/reductase SDR [Proteiniphilum acetatigenes]|uniref:Short-chain dehydrogenase/reductase SDR n=1 Tax=Proteiniphilum acetatigenes TaxID=294710 RepID=A0A101HL70_9BACT|nr:MAG: short-chain dehydrogenase/reductase SDR [Proteiniphilum acetatigenes]